MGVAGPSAGVHGAVDECFVEETGGTTVVSPFRIVDGIAG
jgi:hypothetical protein